MKYKKTQVSQNPSQKLFMVSQDIQTETISGGQVIAYFYFEEDADDFIEFLTNKNK